MNSKFQKEAPKDASKGPQILTDRIKATEVRLIDDEDNRIVTRKEAEQIAAERGLDLIVMSLDSSPPVVRLMDFGRYKYEIEKKAREAKKRQHVIEIKEIKMGIRIDQHDYQVKVRRAAEFLEDGHKVKMTIRMKGRETQHTNLAFDLGKRFVVDLQDAGQPEHDLKLEGRQLIIHIAPLKTAPKKLKSDKDSQDAQDENP